MLSSAEVDELVGARLAQRYLLERFVGARRVCGAAGAHLRLYDANDGTIAEAVSVTTLTAVGISQEGLGEFFATCEQLEQLDHPSLTPIIDRGVEPGGPLFVVEPYGWHTLEQELSLRGRFRADVVRDLAAQLLEGLEALHGYGLTTAGLTTGSLRLVFGRDGGLRLQLSLVEIALLSATQRARASVGADLHAAAEIIADMTMDPSRERQVLAQQQIGVNGSAVADDSDHTPTPRREAPRGGLARIVTARQQGARFETAAAMRAELDAGDAAEAEAELRAPPGSESFGRYRLMHLLAKGGMGEIYLARAQGISGIRGLDRVCVIKSIQPKLAREPEFVERFIAEARVLVSLSHGNIISVHDVGRVDDTFYIAMEYVAGKDLRRVLNRASEVNERLPLAHCLYIARELANGLAYAHRVKVQGVGGLVHRDVSPHNAMVSYEGVVKLIDFGLVRGVGGAPTTKQGVVLGKVCYMSPEQATAQPIDRRTDLYSLGLVLFELLTGEPFFNQPTLAQVLKHVTRPRVEPPSARASGIPEDVDAICLRAMAPRAEERYITAEQIRDDLAAVLARIAPRTSPEEVGRFVAAMFERELVSERRLLSGLSGTMPPLAPAASLVRAAESLRGLSPSPVRLESDLRGQQVDGVSDDEAARDAPADGAPPSSTAIASAREPLARGRGRGRLAMLVASTVLFVAAGSAVWWMVKTEDGAVVHAGSAGAATSTGTSAGGSGSADATALVRAGSASGTGTGSGVGSGSAAGASQARANSKGKGTAKRPRAVGFCYVRLRGDDRRWTVRVDGQLKGPLPLVRPIRLRAGRKHTIELRRIGYAPKRATISRLRCKAGYRFDSMLRMRRRRPPR